MSTPNTFSDVIIALHEYAASGDIPAAPYTPAWWKEVRRTAPQFAVSKSKKSKRPDPLNHKGPLCDIKAPVLNKDGSHKHDVKGNPLYHLSEKEKYEGSLGAEVDVNYLFIPGAGQGGVQLTPGKFAERCDGSKERPLKGISSTVKLGRTEGTPHYGEGGMRGRGDCVEVEGVIIKQARYGAPEVFGGIKGWPAKFDRHARVIEIERELDLKKGEYYLATGKKKKALRSVIHAIERRLEEARRNVAAGGGMERLRDFGNHQATTRGAREKEQIRTEGRKDYH